MGVLWCIILATKGTAGNKGYTHNFPEFIRNKDLRQSGCSLQKRQITKPIINKPVAASL